VATRAAPIRFGGARETAHELGAVFAEHGLLTFASAIAFRALVALVPLTLLGLALLAWPRGARLVAALVAGRRRRWVVGGVALAGAVLGPLRSASRLTVVVTCELSLVLTEAGRASPRTEAVWGMLVALVGVFV